MCRSRYRPLVGDLNNFLCSDRRLAVSKQIRISGGWWAASVGVCEWLVLMLPRVR